MRFFQNLATKVEVFYEAIENAGASGMVNQLAGIVTVWITITIMIKGYQALAGKATDPIRDVVWDIFIKVCIMAFAFNVGGYLTLVINAMDGLQSWAGGGMSMYAKLDTLLSSTVKLAGALLNADDSLVPLQGFFAAVMSFIGFGLATLPALIVVIITEFVLKLLLMLAPFMFFALLFGWLKNMFTQWLSLFFANLLTVLIVTLLLNGLTTQVTSFITSANTGLSDGFSLLLIGVKFVIVGIIFFVMIFVAKNMAEKIATVGMESAVQDGFKNLKNFLPGRKQYSK